MFNNQRYLTRGVQAEIPLELQLFMWSCIDGLPEERDYFQVFRLENFNGIQKFITASLFIFSQTENTVLSNRNVNI